MNKKKILFHSNHSKAFTGFGKNLKNILIYLQKTGKYEIVEFANGKIKTNPELQALPWKCIGSLPADSESLRKMETDNSFSRDAGYGKFTIDKVIEDEKPDVYLGIEDIWAFKDFNKKQWWEKINTMIWTTLDSLPILKDAEDIAKSTSNFYTWANFAKKSMKDLGHKHVKCLHGCLNTSKFKRLEDKERVKLRESFGIHQDEFVIGFVFRNQIRKSVPNLLEGFKIFQQNNPKLKTKLLLHTSWEEGWDISNLIKEKRIDPSTVLTTYLCEKCKRYEIKPFKNKKSDCRFCGSRESQKTTEPKFGISDRQLNEIYNLMDVYCHPFTSGGQELPIQEAKLCELITLVTNYSCGEDCCTQTSGGLPLSWSEYREPGTQFIKASTHSESIANQLNKVFKMNTSKKRDLEKKSRKFVIENYSIEVIGSKLEKILDKMPKTEWDFDFEYKQKNQDYQPIETDDDFEWIKDIYLNMLNLEVKDNDEGLHHWLSRLDSDLSRDDVLNFFKDAAKKENNKNKKIDLEDALGTDDKGKRILMVMPESLGDVYLCTSLFKSIKKTYPDYNLYFATKPDYFEILDGNPYVYKLLPYSKDLDNLLKMEGFSDHQGYFEICFLPNIGTQKILNYMHNGKDKIQFDLCT